MGVDARRRQKKLERRAVERKSRQQQLSRAKNIGMGEQLALAGRHPILHSLVTSAIWDQGIGSVYLSRELPGGRVAFGVFLVDRYCLGVKNAMSGIETASHYQGNILRKIQSEYEAEKIAPAAARKLVEGAVAYAQGHGFSPHPDYQTARHIFGDIDATACADVFEFGKDGKPFFISGPFDTPERCRTILKTLAFHRGEGGNDFIMQVGPNFSISPHEIAELEE